MELTKLHFDILGNQAGLEPIISQQTVIIHYNRHHQGYLNNLNILMGDHTFSLQEIILKSHNQDFNNWLKIYNNAAQVYNHDMYWQSLSSVRQTPSDKLCKVLEKQFDSVENFIKEFKLAGLNQFGSGWVWLIAKNDTLEIVTTSNAHTPLVTHRDCKILMVIDVWEHAYYLDYQNKRSDYLDKVMDNLINWNFVEQQFFL